MPDNIREVLERVLLLLLLAVAVGGTVAAFFFGVSDTYAPR